MDAAEQQPAEVSKKQDVFLEFDVHFSMLGENGTESDSGEARLVLDEKSLGLKGVGKKASYIPLRDIYEINSADYTIILKLSSLENLTLSQLGYDYENFQRELSQRLRDLTLSDLLMEEPLKMGGLHAVYRYLDSAGMEKQTGNCELRLYQTALIIVPELNIPARLPYSEINTIIREDYRVTVRNESGEEFIFDQMGRDLETLIRALAELIQSLELAGQAMVKELMPSADLETIRKLALLMKEGRATRRVDIEVLGPQLWAELELHLLGSEAGDEYKFLKSLGQAQDICIGFKRGLMAGESDYLWFMVPVYAPDNTKPGNAVIMEAVSTEGESRATYAFRMVSRKDYPNFKTISELQMQMGKFIQTINRALIAINFRREPIYLTDEMLTRTQYEKYHYSITRIPELQTLRWLYIGRVVHTTQVQWQKDIKDLLIFNVSTQEDGKLWVKKETEPTSETQADAG